MGGEFQRLKSDKLIQIDVISIYSISFQREKHWKLSAINCSISLTSKTTCAFEKLVQLVDDVHELSSKFPVTVLCFRNRFGPKHHFKRAIASNLYMAQSE